MLVHVGPRRTSMNRRTSPLSRLFSEGSRPGRASRACGSRTGRGRRGGCGVRWAEECSEAWRQRPIFQLCAYRARSRNVGGHHDRQPCFSRPSRSARRSLPRAPFALGAPAGVLGGARSASAMVEHDVRSSTSEAGRYARSLIAVSRNPLVSQVSKAASPRRLRSAVPSPCHPEEHHEHERTGAPKE